MPSIPLPLIPWSRTTLLTARTSLGASVTVQQTALDLFSLYDAWDGTQTLPICISAPDPDKIFNGRDSDNQPSKRRWEELGTAWVEGLPEEMRKRAREGKLNAEDLKVAREQMRASQDRGTEGKDLTIGAVVQIAMLAGDEEQARELIENHVTGLYRHMQELWDDPEVDERETRKWLGDHLGLHHSPEIWKILKNTALGEALNVDEEALGAFVNEGCNLIRQRFTQGPTRPFANKSISELLQILDESYVAARKANPEAGEHMSILSIAEIPSSFLKGPATAHQITELEERLKQHAAPDSDDDNEDDDNDDYSPILTDEHLPDDYKDFLRQSNGFYVDEPADSTGLFYDTEMVGTDDTDFLQDMDFTLFPYEYTSVTEIDNIPLNNFVCFSIGAGGDEGQVVLIPPSSVKPVLEAFEKTYADASEVNKRYYERAALDLYGGLEALRQVEWLCVVWYHWDPAQKIWGSFRGHLEHCVEYAVKRRREDEKEAEKREHDEGNLANK
ncbi:uncharacterized protein K460DRAFT_386735 [Cucurbitaria berberidis CBS 394.84]|uniref:Knr4/Smi1-like domain-containing protein n=1 Tax=Cucurbitaria berberidis CBS 394.84 TaxID=1168544 RepID=A0A9P4L8Z2_9PLEO|nr:uncharacterized protein K460DRAFT_386735 [Cucurbitaria berberidis CBS 394.84]KAF1846545.1 hypothetical protein K460DRAFT_386735 [Cucurbitaria berberidis CBS 394.84]